MKTMPLFFSARVRRTLGSQLRLPADVHLSRGVLISVLTFFWVAGSPFQIPIDLGTTTDDSIAAMMNLNLVFHADNSVVEAILGRYVENKVAWSWMFLHCFGIMDQLHQASMHVDTMPPKFFLQTTGCSVVARIEQQWGTESFQRVVHTAWALARCW
jgi:hypothetical protein